MLLNQFVSFSSLFLTNTLMCQ